MAMTDPLTETGADGAIIIFPDHPCRRCGACCASFRVSFYWGEIADEGAPGAPGESLTGVPVALTERLDAHRSCMVGTNARRPRCVALEGAVGDHVGEGVACAIYDRRPSTCREFLAHGEVGGDPAAGVNNPVCTRARARYGLSPLPDLWRWDVS